MCHRAADRTRLLIFQCFRQDSRLLIQKGPVLFPVNRFLFFQLICRCPISVLRFPKLVSQAPVSLKLSCEGVQFIPFLPCLLPLPDQTFSQFSGMGVCLLFLPEFFQVKRLPFPLPAECFLLHTGFPDRSFQPFQLLLPFLQTLIRGKFRLDRGKLRLKSLLLRLRSLLLLPFFLCLRKLLRGGDPLLSRLLKLLLRSLQLSGSAQLLAYP